MSKLILVRGKAITLRGFHMKRLRYLWSIANFANGALSQAAIFTEPEQSKLRAIHALALDLLDGQNAEYETLKETLPIKEAK
jgi:hypothetical protein